MRMRNRLFEPLFCLVAVLGTLGCLDMRVAVGGTLKSDLEQGLLGLKWGAPAEEVKRVFPEAKSVGLASTPQFSVKAPAGVWGVQPSSFLLTATAQGGFTEAHFSLEQADIAKAIDELRKGLGEGRHVAMKDAGFYSQVYE